jgi:hypothetical protein
MQTERKSEQAETELTELAAAIAAAAGDLAAAESAEDTSVKGLDAHARIASRLAMLRTRQATLAAELPGLRLADMQAETEELRESMTTAAANLKSVETDLLARLAAIMGLAETAYVVNEAMMHSTAWMQANQALRRAMGLQSSKHAQALEFARKNGLNAA